jgi:hypothetical protein
MLIILLMLLSACTSMKIPYVFPGKEVRGLSPNSYMHVHVSNYIFPGSVHKFGCSKIAPLTLRIKKSLTDT